MNNNRPELRKAHFLALLLVLTACSQVSESFDTIIDNLGIGPKTAAPTITPVPTPTPGAIIPDLGPQKNLELIWQVPNEPVEAYHLYLIDAQGEEKRHYRILVSKLKKEDDPTYGPIYRYALPDALRGESTTIRIRAENRFGLSEPSEPMIVGQ